MRKGKSPLLPGRRESWSQDTARALVWQQKFLNSPPAGEGKDGKQAIRAGGVPFAPNSRLPARAGAARYLTLTLRRLPASTGSPRSHIHAGSAGKAISSRAATLGRENRARRPPLRMPGPRGTRTAPAFQHAHGDCSPGSRSPLKHLLWRLETEFENSPISGGRWAGPGQSRGGVAQADRPSEPWRSGPRVSPAPAQLLPPRPLPLPGTWKPRAWQLIPAAAAGPGGRGKLRWGRAGRREEGCVWGAALLLCIKDPLKFPGLAARGVRGHCQGKGKQMEFGKAICTPWMLPPPPPPVPSNLRTSQVAQACWGKLPNSERWCDT